MTLGRGILPEVERETALSCPLLPCGSKGAEVDTRGSEDGGGRENEREQVCLHITFP